MGAQVLNGRNADVVFNVKFYLSPARLLKGNSISKLLSRPIARYSNALVLLAFSKANHGLFICMI